MKGYDKRIDEIGYTYFIKESNRINAECIEKALEKANHFAQVTTMSAHHCIRISMVLLNPDEMVDILDEAEKIYEQMGTARTET